MFTSTNPFTTIQTLHSSHDLQLRKKQRCSQSGTEPYEYNCEQHTFMSSKPGPVADSRNHIQHQCQCVWAKRYSQQRWRCLAHCPTARCINHPMPRYVLTACRERSTQLSGTCPCSPAAVTHARSRTNANKLPGALTPCIQIEARLLHLKHTCQAETAPKSLGVLRPLQYSESLSIC